MMRGSGPVGSDSDYLTSISLLKKPSEGTANSRIPIRLSDQLSFRKRHKQQNRTSSKKAESLEALTNSRKFSDELRIIEKTSQVPEGEVRIGFAQR